MPDLGTGPTAPEITYLSIKDVAYLTRRREDYIRRLIRAGDIEAIRDPEDKRTKLVPDTELTKVLRRPEHGWTKRRVRLTKSDGTTLTRLIPVRKEG